MRINLRKLLFIYNPKSGRGVIGLHLAEIIKAFESAGYIPTIYRTRLKDDASFMAEHEGPNYDLVVCAGGDGTLNGVISGIMNLDPEKRPPIGFIPTGSTNDTRNSFKLPLNIARAASVSVNGIPFETDIGKCNNKFFTYVAAFGEISAVAAFTPQDLKNVFGHAAYIPEGLKAITKMDSHYIKVTYDDDQVIEGDFFLGMVTNATSVGGFVGITGTSVDLQDGLFELMLFKKPFDLFELTKEINAVIIPDATGGDLVTRVKANKIRFESEDEVQWVVDGEDAGKFNTVNIELFNKAVKIMCGPGIGARKHIFPNNSYKAAIERK